MRLHILLFHQKLLKVAVGVSRVSQPTLGVYMLKESLFLEIFEFVLENQLSN